MAEVTITLRDIEGAKEDEHPLEVDMVVTGDDKGEEFPPSYTAALYLTTVAKDAQMLNLLMTTIPLTYLPVISDEEAKKILSGEEQLELPLET